jgi:sarcosine oxidase subunit gamma
MSEQLARRHPLENFMNGRADTELDHPGVSVTLQPGRDHVNLRGPTDDAGFRRVVEAELRQSLPLTSNTFTTGEQIAYWLGPDEWLISAVPKLQVCERLLALPGQDSVAVNSQSGGLLQLKLTGQDARALLAKGCTLNLHPSEFRVGHCAQTLLAKADILLALADDTPTFCLLVRRSFAEYLALWLEHSGSEYGIAFGLERPGDE